MASGVMNASAEPIWVICPAVRSPTTSNVVSVYVDGMANSGTTISCTLFVWDYNGSFMGSQAFNNPPLPKFDEYLSVQGSYWGTASVACLLPGNYAGEIFDVDVVQ
jgi:hypothetical protein